MKHILPLLFLSLNLQAQSIFYVNQAVPGGQQNGASWTNAYSDLQQALALAKHGDEVWVAKGQYFPTASTNRNISFVWKNGVKLYGGFAGTESNLSERDYELNETILSGNIGGPGGADNSYHVMYGAGLDSTSVLDGFTITHGIASGDEPPSTNEKGGGLLLESSFNGSISAPQIANCRFAYNYAQYGGGVYCAWDGGSLLNPVFRNCVFEGNRVLFSGGGLYKAGPGLPDKPYVLEQCTFTRNSTSLMHGGGVYMVENEFTTIFKNCQFEKDTSRFGIGGAVYFTHDKDCSLLVEGGTFKGNYGSETSAIYMHANNDLISQVTFQMNNSQFLENRAATFATVFVSGGAEGSRLDADIFNCQFEDNIVSNYCTGVRIGADVLNLNVGNCTFIENKSTVPTGTVYVFRASGNHFLSNFTNCLFAKNQSGIACTPGDGAQGEVHITNCTFYENGEIVFEKRNPPAGTGGYNNWYINNCIIVDDATYDKMFSDYSLFSAYMDGYFIDYTYLSLDDEVSPKYPFGDHTVFNFEPDFLDPQNNDFHLNPCDSTINKGLNTLVDSLGLSLDLDGLPRIRFQTVDLGAYEKQEPCITINTAELQNIHKWIQLSPNPIQPGNKLNVTIPFVISSGVGVTWSILDMAGRVLSNGVSVTDESGSFAVDIPPIEGMHLLELNHSGWKSVMKVLVIK
jgi:hypothetical protein